jgi:hypothetical protein
MLRNHSHIFAREMPRLRKLEISLIAAVAPVPQVHPTLAEIHRSTYHKAAARAHVAAIHVGKFAIKIRRN